MQLRPDYIVWEYINTLSIMTLSVLLILAGVNFIVVAAHVCTRKFNYPFWVYAAMALFCWWPLVIFPIRFLAEERLAQTAGKRAAARGRFKLSAAVLAGSILLQGCGALYVRTVVPELSFAEAVQVQSVMTSLLLTLILLYAEHLQEQSVRRIGE